MPAEPAPQPPRPSKDEGGDDDDDARHRREEDDRRAKRKASKQSRTAEQIEKEKKRQKYRQEILQKHGVAVAGGTKQQQSSSSKSAATTSGSSTKEPTGSQFTEQLFGSRTQGFQIEFRFRNAPPRPPVGPCFVGETIDTVLYQASKSYKPFNTVEVHHTWKLHTENDIGVPLAPTAMDNKSYKDITTNNNNNRLHPDDDAILNWRGNMGDTAAEQMKHRQEQLRANARLAAVGRTVPITSSSSAVPTSNNNKMIQPTNTTNNNNKKSSTKVPAFASRVLHEDMKTWMKKTTYLSNNYARKVHDFKSLAKTKTELSEDLRKKQQEMASRRSVTAIVQSFTKNTITTSLSSSTIKHPTNPKLKPKAIYTVLPDVSNWGRAYTQVVIDKAPITLPTGQTPAVLSNSTTFITNVSKPSGINQTDKLSCHVIVPAAPERIDLYNKHEDETKTIKDDEPYYESIQKYDLDVIPLRDDEPHTTFAWIMDTTNHVVRYIPIASRVTLSTGRPPSKNMNSTSIRSVYRRPLTDDEQIQLEEKMAEMDHDLAVKYNKATTNSVTAKVSTIAGSTIGGKSFMTTRSTRKKNDDGDDDSDGVNSDNMIDDDDDDDDDDSDEEVFGGGRKTIVAND